MRLILSATVLAAAFTLAGCDAADRAALSGAQPPAPVAAAPTQLPVSGNTALLFPPAATAPQPVLSRVAATSPHGLRHHPRLVRPVRSGRVARHDARWSHVQRTVMGLAYARPDGRYEREMSERADARARWDERRSAYAEGYGAEGYRAEGYRAEGYEAESYRAGGYGRGDRRIDRAPMAAGRDRDGFLTWPGKVSDGR